MQPQDAWANNVLDHDWANAYALKKHGHTSLHRPRHDEFATPIIRVNKLSLTQLSLHCFNFIWWALLLEVAIPLAFGGLVLPTSILE